MKKLALLSLVALLFVACSKEQRQSRKLDGSWNLVSYAGQGLASGESEVFTFTKDKKGKGDGVYNYTEPGFSISAKFTYQIVGDQLSIFDEDGFGESFTIDELKRKDLTIRDSDGDISVYEKQ